MRTSTIAPSASSLSDLSTRHKDKSVVGERHQSGLGGSRQQFGLLLLRRDPAVDPGFQYVEWQRTVLQYLGMEPADVELGAQG